jgi:hypothetical protein
MIEIRYDIEGDRKISNFFRKEEYPAIVGKFERNYTIDLSSLESPLTFDFKGMGAVTKLMVITERFKSAKLKFFMKPPEAVDYSYDMEFTDNSILTFTPAYSALIDKIELTTDSETPTSIEIRAYAFA